MKLLYHKLVQRDVLQITRYYTEQSGEKLANEFFDELMTQLELAAAEPERFHLDASGLRRANLPRFPFHFLYRVRQESILVLVVRHHKRHPSFGLRRSRP